MPRIAFPTDDGETISAHLGRASLFLVAEYEGDGEARFERRAKPQHGQHQHAAPAGAVQLHAEPHEHHDEHHDEHEHHGPDAHTGHGGVLAPIADCQTLIAGGMGQPAYEGAQRLGLTIVLTGEKRISAALAAYRAGALASDLRRVHAH